MSDIEKLLQKVKKLEEKLNYTFNDKNLLTLAFIHRSFVNENKNCNLQHNERLEFLGDAVLGTIITEFLYKNLPDTPEGDLSPLRSRIVNATSCTEYVKKLDIENYILLGKGEKSNNRRSKDSILADLFEAIIGAIYLDKDLQAVRNFFFHHFEDHVLDVLHKPSNNWKAILQDYSQKKYQQPPEYKIISEDGPDHNKTFVISALINDKQLGQGCGKSKKEAEQAAAGVALTRISHKSGLLQLDEND